MSSVRALADEIRGHHEHVDVLTNNAWALFPSRRETSEGLEQTFALNHLAPFLLTNLLRDRLAGGRVGQHLADRPGRRTPAWRTSRLRRVVPA